MKIIFKESFVRRLESQIEYIFVSNPDQAKKFKLDILNRINQIPSNPFKHRKSIYFDDITIRDLTFKGYTVVFRINEDTIEVFGFVKYQNFPL